MEGFGKGMVQLKTPLLVGLLLALMTLVLYLPVQSFDFINMDDPTYVTQNHQVLGGLTMEGLRWSLTNLEAGFWQPITWLSHMLDCELYGLDAGGHHWTNVLIHCAGTVFLFGALLAMTGALWCSALVAALFAIHPLHVESVAWVAERKDVLSGLFWFLTMGAYACYVRQPTLWRYLLVLVAFVLGLLSKPMAVTLPFVLLLLDSWPLGRFTQAHTAFDGWLTAVRAPGSRLVAEKVPLIILSILFGLIAFTAERNVGALPSITSHPLDVRVANALLSYALYLKKTIWPVDLIVFYPHMGMPPLGQLLASAALILSVTGIVLRFRRQAPYLAVGWFWYLGTLVPVIGLVQIGSHAMADRYTYIPLVGLFIMLAFGLKEAFARARLARAFLALATAGMLAGMTFGTHLQIKTWENSFTLFGHALRINETNFMAHNNMGSFLLHEGRCDLAIPHFLRVLEIQEDYLKAHYNLGVCAYRDGDPERAIRYFRKVVDLDPCFMKGWMSLGLTQLQQRQLDDAEQVFQTVLTFNPCHEAAGLYMGVTYLEQGRLSEAETMLRKVVQRYPQNEEAKRNLAQIIEEKSGADPRAD